jgi:glycosyltransferase involved in cell wall biosynthesis
MLVVGTTDGGTGAHVRMLAAGLAARGVAVTIAGPPSADAAFAFSALPAVTFFPVRIGARPRAGDLAAALRLRRLLARWSAVLAGGAGPVAVHAHGLRAGAFTVLALRSMRDPRGRRVRAVVTVHNAPPGGGLSAAVYRALECLVAKGADQVLCVSPDLEARLRAAGARGVARAVVAAYPAEPVTAEPVTGDFTSREPVIRSPYVLAAGRLAEQKGFGTLLEAAARWQDLDPCPGLVIAGDGPLAGRLRARAANLGVAAAFPGRVSELPAMLARAAVFVLPSNWEGQPLVLQEALRAGVPIVATRVGGVPGLVGGAALLVAAGDAAELAAAVRMVLTDPALAARLRAAAAAAAKRLPAEADAVAAALAAYAARP